jgi:hypothetical protein
MRDDRVERLGAKWLFGLRRSGLAIDCSAGHMGWLISQVASKFFRFVFRGKDKL